MISPRGGSGLRLRPKPCSSVLSVVLLFAFGSHRDGGASNSGGFAAALRLGDGSGAHRSLWEEPDIVHAHSIDTMPGALKHIIDHLEVAFDDHGQLEEHHPPLLVSPEMESWMADWCHASDVDAGTGALEPASKFDAMIAELFVNDILNPVDRFADALAEICVIETTREVPGELKVNEACMTPEMVEVVRKTSLALRKFDDLRRPWLGWAETKTIIENEHDHPDEFTAHSWPNQSKFGWKKLLVSLMLVNPSSRSMWAIDHNEELGDALCNRETLLHFARATPPQVLSPEVLERLNTLRRNIVLASAPQATVAASAHTDGTVDQAVDTTYAATHLTDFCEGLDSTHQLVEEATVPIEVKNLLKTATAITSNDFKSIPLLSDASSITDELVVHGHISQLGPVDDIMSLASLSQMLTKSASTVSSYAKAKGKAVFLAKLAKIASAAPIFGVAQAQALAKAAPELSELEEMSFEGNPVEEAQLLMELVKGSDAMVRLASLWERLPRDVCETLDGNFVNAQEHIQGIQHVLHNFF